MVGHVRKSQLRKRTQMLFGKSKRWSCGVAIAAGAVDARPQRQSDCQYFALEKFYFAQKSFTLLTGAVIPHRLNVFGTS